MKILSLNLHCFAEENIVEKQKLIAETIIKEDIDIVFLQEVAQTEKLSIMFDDIKSDNYGYAIKNLLNEKGYQYDFHYKIGNRSFALYDEGLAILSKTKLIDKKHFFVSNKVDYEKWYTRVIVTAKTEIEGIKISLTSVHLGWTGGDEVFEDQVDKLLDNLDPNDINIIAGDFNVNAGSKEYNYVIKKGYIDLFHNGEKEYFNLPTHLDNIDKKIGSDRIDYILSNREFEVMSREILFKENRVSDHFGVMMEIQFKGAYNNGK